MTHRTVAAPRTRQPSARARDPHASTAPSTAADALAARTTEGAR